MLNKSKSRARDIGELIIALVLLGCAALLMLILFGLLCGNLGICFDG